MAMTSRLLELKEDLFSVCHGGMWDGKRVMSDKDRKGLWILDTQWSVMEDVTRILRPLAVATEFLTSESTPTAGAVYYLLKELAQELKVKPAPAPESDNEEDLMYVE